MAIQGQLVIEEGSEVKEYARRSFGRRHRMIDKKPGFSTSMTGDNPRTHYSFDTDRGQVRWLTRVMGTPFWLDILHQRLLFGPGGD